jgi:hypothetical protein
MRWLRAAPRAVWDFVVGDDWRSAVGVVLALGLTGLVAGLGVSAWWVMPLAVLALLWRSILRAARKAGRTQGPPGGRRGEAPARPSRPSARWGAPLRAAPGGDTHGGTGRQASGEARGAEDPARPAGTGRRAPMHHH